MHGGAMKTSELVGAELDYWVARAEGIPAEQLEIRRVQRLTDTHCVRSWVRNDPIIGRDIVALRYSTDWAQGGPLLEKYEFDLSYEVEDRGNWVVLGESYSFAPTPLQAICRAVVRAKFGDEVPDEKS
jgi:hypothetical protein